MIATPAGISISPPAMVIVDIETSGLKPRYGKIFEVGFLVVDRDLKVVNAKQFTIVDEDSYVAMRRLQSRVTLGTASEGDRIVWGMHTGSGLAEEIFEGYRLNRWNPHVEVEQRAIAWLEETGVIKGDLPMTGSSIRFDRAWLEYHMPTLENFFHYRVIDVSSHKETFRFFDRTDVIDSRPPVSKDHRSVADCYNTLSEFQHYAQHLGFIL